MRFRRKKRSRSRRSTRSTSGSRSRTAKSRSSTESVPKSRGSASTLRSQSKPQDVVTAQKDRPASVLTGETFHTPSGKDHKYTLNEKIRLTIRKTPWPRACLRLPLCGGCFKCRCFRRWPKCQFCCMIMAPFLCLYFVWILFVVLGIWLLNYSDAGLTVVTSNDLCGNNGRVLVEFGGELTSSILFHADIRSFKVDAVSVVDPRLGRSSNQAGSLRSIGRLEAPVPERPLDTVVKVGGPNQDYRFVAALQTMVNSTRQTAAGIALRRVLSGQPLVLDLDVKTDLVTWSFLIPMYVKPRRRVRVTFDAGANKTGTSTNRTSNTVWQIRSVSAARARPVTAVIALLTDAPIDIVVPSLGWILFEDGNEVARVETSDFTWKRGTEARTTLTVKQAIEGSDESVRLLLSSISSATQSGTAPQLAVAGWPQYVAPGRVDATTGSDSCILQRSINAIWPPADVGTSPQDIQSEFNFDIDV